MKLNYSFHTEFENKSQYFLCINKLFATRPFITYNNVRRDYGYEREDRI
jgi:hypothetical protein